MNDLTCEEPIRDWAENMNCTVEIQKGGFRG